ncbi:MAG: hypothetical protein ACMXX6_01070 [Candidatus Woesearchaeota archaeon]
MSLILEFKKHYFEKEKEIEEKLKEFEEVSKSGDLFEEMVFCVFAANSSAEMGLKASKLLKPHFSKSLEDYKKAVYKKVRFYNVRSEYAHHNKHVFDENKDFLEKLRKMNFYDRRMFIKNNFKGFGMKESSHYLRNIGFKGYAILDKHVVRLLFEFGVLKSDKSPRNEKEYLDVEKKLVEYANKNLFCIDKLDLALWSFKTGKIIK